MSRLITYVVSTNEVDDIELAARDILSQVPLEDLKKNTLGIVACHYEFGFSGALEHVVKALPFEVVGTISSAQGSAQRVGNFELMITILTSDEVFFATALSEPLIEDTRTKVRTTFHNAARTLLKGPALTADPDLILVHVPFMMQNNGDDYLEELSEVSENKPLFGTLAIDDTPDFRNCFSIYNGQTHNDRLVLTLIKGVTPRFFSANISPNKIVGEPAVITESRGAFLSRVNDRPIVEYLEERGLVTLVENGYAMAATPFILDYGDGTPPISRIFIQLTPDGKVLLNGSSPEGATFVLGSFDKEDALATTGAAIREALASIASEDDSRDGVSFMLIYSCIGRSMALGSDYLVELELVQSLVGERIPFMMAYSGGEYCPTENTADSATNRFHNNALIVCML